MNRCRKNLALYLLLFLLVPSLSTRARYRSFQEIIPVVLGEQFSVLPKQIDITFFYHGGNIQVDFLAPPEYDPVLVLEGESDSMVLNRKGRVGIFWLNLDEVELKNAPHVYHIYSSKHLSQLAPDQLLATLRLGYDALGKDIEVRSDALEKEVVFSEFVKFQERSGMYRMVNGSLQPFKRENGLEHYSFQIPISSAMPVGRYRIKLFYFYENRCVQEFSETIILQKVGFTSFITKLAFEHASLYGILAIVVAVVMGFSIGFLFSLFKRR